MQNNLFSFKNSSFSTLFLFCFPPSFSSLKDPFFSLSHRPCALFWPREDCKERNYFSHFWYCGIFWNNLDGRMLWTAKGQCCLDYGYVWALIWNEKGSNFQRMGIFWFWANKITVHGKGYQRAFGLITRLIHQRRWGGGNSFSSLLVEKKTTNTNLFPLFDLILHLFFEYLPLHPTFCKAYNAMRFAGEFIFNSLVANCRCIAL